MSRGFSLPGLLFAMLLGSSCLWMALSRYEMLRTGLQSFRRMVDEQQALRMVLFQLAHDLRQHGQAGCQAWQESAVTNGASVTLSWGESDWHIVDVTQDEAGRLARLVFRRLAAGDGNANQLVLYSCARLDRLQVGVDFMLHDVGLYGRLDFLSERRPLIGGQHGHHLPSLEIGPLVSRRYDWSKGVLRRDGQPLMPLAGFHVSTTAAGLWQLRLTPQDRVASWQLNIAHRQQGMAMLVVMVLMLAGLLLLGSGQRLLLDDGRQVLHERQWTQALFRAEFALRQAEKQVWQLAHTPEHTEWFRPACQFANAPREWRSGLCLPARREELPVWLRGEADEVLSPCGSAVCIAVPLPAWLVGRRFPDKKPSCHQDPRDGPIDPDPCYIVELLDQNFHGAALYRITVRAWGRTVRSSVTLQSYYKVQGEGQRLSWRML